MVLNSRHDNQRKNWKQLGFSLSQALLDPIHHHAGGAQELAPEIEPPLIDGRHRAIGQARIGNGREGFRMEGVNSLVPV